ncbi:MAG: hypothetical protein PVJ27_08035 [Candidatus Brocadiaceae bacterium]|jgi:hypothetical protein
MHRLVRSIRRTSRPRLARSVCVIWGLLCLLGSPNLEAGVAVSPLQQELEVQPGRETRFFITLDNIKRKPEDLARDLALEVVDFSVSHQGGLSFGPEAEHARSARSWVRLEESHVILQPGEKKRIAGTIRAPLDADGDYWAAIMMTMGHTARPSGVNVVLRTASALFVRVTRRGHVVRPRIRSVAVKLPTPEQETPAGEGSAAKPVLEVAADVANQGVRRFVGSGMATFYLDGRRQVARVPLATRRRRVLPGDTRRFIGVLAAPLPAGKYVVRCVLETDSSGGRKAFAEAELEISERLAKWWAEHGAGVTGPGLQTGPAELRLEMRPGRFTSAGISVANVGVSTMEVTSRLEPADLPEAWVEFGSKEMALGPQMRRSLMCRIAVPRDAEPGLYRGTISVEAKVAGLVGAQATASRRIPVFLSVGR